MARKSRFVTEFERTRGRLPHWEGPGETYFVTFCLKRPPAADLTCAEIGPLVVGALRFHDSKRYDLYDYTVMPDHVHAIVRPIVRDGVAERITCIMDDVKHWLAVMINRLVGRSGQLWQTETHNHALRNEDDYVEKAKYIFDNAQTAGLTDGVTGWPWWGQGNGPR